MLKVLIFSLMMEGGWQPADNTLALGKVPHNVEFGVNNSWYLKFYPKLDIGPVYVSGGLTTETDFAGSDSKLFGQPYYTTYDIEVGVNIKNFTVGTSHMCAHSTFIAKNKLSDFSSLDDSHTRIFLRYKLSTQAIQD